MAKVEKGTAENPWKLKTPLGTSESTMHRATVDGPEILVFTVAKTILHYDYRSLADLHAMLKKHGHWMELGAETRACSPDLRSPL